MKRVFAGIITAILASTMLFAGVANAAPTATSSLEIEPATVYKDALSPVKLSLNAKVTPEPGAITMKPMVNVKLSFPNKLTFVPHDNVTPVCPLSKIGPNNTNFPTDAALQLCASSLVGDGNADLFLAQLVGTPITDAKILAFNGGHDGSGNPILNLHAYSPSVNTGVFMTGTLKGGVLDVKIPRLAADSSVPRFQINLPGTQGKDPNYVQASCPTGDWVSSSVITLANRSDTGQISDSEDLKTPSFDQKCEGKAGGSGGKAKFGSLKVKGPKSVKAGQKATYKVTVKNAGKKAIKSAKVAANGKGAKGNAGAGTLKPGKAKTVKVKVKFTKKGVAKVKFKATGKGAKAKTKVFKVKVK